MGKRSDFKRRELDYYPTPMAAVLPLLPHLPHEASFCEPCAGEGILINHLESRGHTCVSAFDIMPMRQGMRQHDASFITRNDLNGADTIITNPPWDRKPLHQIIERCSEIAPTWLLFDADWMHTAQASRLLLLCRKIVSVGRVRWIEGSSMSGKDNSCWYLFDAHQNGETIFVGRKT